MIRLIPFLLMAGPAAADIVVATRTIPARSVIAEGDLGFDDREVPGAVTDPGLLIGMEARVAIYPGRPIAPGDVGPPATVERNQIVTLIYSGTGLTITTEGRALDRAGPGDAIQVMNLASRATVTAVIGLDGAAHVAP